MLKKIPNLCFEMWFYQFIYSSTTRGSSEPDYNNSWEHKFRCVDFSQDNTGNSVFILPCSVCDSKDVNYVSMSPKSVLGLKENLQHKRRKQILSPFFIKFQLIRQLMQFFVSETLGYIFLKANNCCICAQFSIHVD